MKGKWEKGKERMVESWRRKEVKKGGSRVLKGRFSLACFCWTPDMNENDLSETEFHDNSLKLGDA